MTGVYFQLVIIITNSLVLLCYSHAIPKGFHLSRTCRPVCESKETCVIYKNSDDLARSVCVLVDPHRMVLDGTILVPVKNPVNSFKRHNLSKTDSVRQKHILDTGTLTKQSQNDVVQAASKTDYVLQKQTLDTGNVIESTQNDAFQTARLKANTNRPQSVLINQLATLSNSLRHGLLWELDSLGERTKTSDNLSGKVHNKSKSLNYVEDIPSSNSKTFDSRQDMLSGLFFVRDEKGRVVFRRVNQNSTERTAAKNLTPTKHMEGELSTTFNITNTKAAANSSQTLVTSPAGFKPHINIDESNDIARVLGNKTMSCRSCDPDHACPGGYYCYFSATCAKQICQPL